MKKGYYEIRATIHPNYMTILPEENDTLRDLLTQFPQHILMTSFLDSRVLTVSEWISVLDGSELDKNTRESGFSPLIYFIDDTKARKYRHTIMFSKNGQSMVWFNEIKGVC